MRIWCSVLTTPWRVWMATKRQQPMSKKSKNFIESLREIRQETELPVRVRLLFNGEGA